MDYRPAGMQHSHTGSLSSHDLARVSYFLGTTTAASAAWPAANLAIYVPFWLEHPVTVYEVWVETGTLTTSNGIEIGCYSAAGARMFNTAMTITTASDTVNSSGMTDVVLDAGVHYMAMSCDGTRNFLATGLALGIYQAAGIMEQTGLTGASLPATWTAAVFTRAYLPLFGFNFRSTAL